MNIIISPIITEKSMAQAGLGKYSFIVDIKADKKDIKKAVEKSFNVSVIGVSTSIVKGRSQRVGQRRVEKKVSPFKKAIVALKAGEKIGLFELSEEKKK